VQHLHKVGQGCPDILVGKHGVNILMEIKDGSKVPSAQKLNERQVKWHEAWNGNAYVVNSIEAALTIIKEI